MKQARQTSIQLPRLHLHPRNTPSMHASRYPPSPDHLAESQHTYGGPVVRAGTDAALPVARLLAGLRDDGRDDVVDAQHNGSLGTRRDTQLLRWVLSFDRERSCDPLAVTANAAALWLSDVPLRKLVAAAMAGYVDKRLVLNLTIGQMKHSRLNLTVADTKDHGRGQEGAEVVLDATRHG